MNWVKVSFEDFASNVYGYWYDRPYKVYGASIFSPVEVGIPQVPWRLALLMRCTGWAFVKPGDTNPGECWSEEVFSEIDVNLL